MQAHMQGEPPGSSSLAHSFGSGSLHATQRHPHCRARAPRGCRTTECPVPWLSAGCRVRPSSASLSCLLPRPLGCEGSSALRHLSLACIVFALFVSVCVFLFFFMKQNRRRFMPIRGEGAWGISYSCMARLLLQAHGFSSAASKASAIS
jgi:hypothetical protein